MRRWIVILTVLCTGAIVLSAFKETKAPEIEILDRPVWDVLSELGASRPSHFPSKYTPEEVQRGFNIVNLGKSDSPDGKHGSYISKFYVCTSCHNTVREDPDLSVVDPEARLTYANQNNVAYLQSSTFWGIVNRESWYNDDYVKKYGDLVTEANKSLEASIQLCATVCSQGRRLEDWEMRSVLAYFWSLQYNMKDLNLSSSELNQIQNAVSNKQHGQATIDLIKSKYLKKSPATFSEPPKDKLIGYGMKGRPEKGEQIFRLGCQHCHRPKGESDVVFNDATSTYRWFYRHLTDNTQLSIYHIIRYGTYAQTGHKEYMPHYTLEKMSHQQVEDLRAFIVQESGKDPLVIK